MDHGRCIDMQKKSWKLAKYADDALKEHEEVLCFIFESCLVKAFSESAGD